VTTSTLFKIRFNDSLELKRSFHRLLALLADGFSNMWPMALQRPMKN